MFLYRIEVPDLILIESLLFSLFVIDFNGPAMASNWVVVDHSLLPEVIGNYNILLELLQKPSTYMTFAGKSLAIPGLSSTAPWLLPC
jgi:hypothetical protein